MVTLVLGGVRSGKSRWAQELAGTVRRVTYLATAQACDEEMKAKIRRHQMDRPVHWKIVEEPLELGSVIADCAAESELLLVDCLTIFVANLLDSEETEPGSMETRISALLDALRASAVPIVLVSNEVGCGVVPPYPLGRMYRDALGELNQRVAAIADNVVLMMAGLPLALKGSLGARP
jgi:adenosylcobinamide kinase/adenosylcobinamide-phosphate guanylyltransferase